MTYLIAAVKEKHKFDICFLIHDSVPALKVVLVAGETVYEETELFLILLHGLFHGLNEQEQKTNEKKNSFDVIFLQKLFIQMTNKDLISDIKTDQLKEQCFLRVQLSYHADKQTN